MTMQDGIRAVQHAFTQGTSQPRWPMYVRQAKQYLRAAIENFDERKYGFASVVDLLRAAGKEGVLRIERDRQGAIRIFPGANLVSKQAAAGEPVADDPTDVEEIVDVPGEVQAADVESVDAVSSEPAPAAEQVAEPPIVEGEVAGGDDDDDDDDDERVSDDDDVNGNVITPEPKKPAPAARRRKTSASRPARAPRAAKTARPRARKTSR